MRQRYVLAVAIVATACGAGVALAAHPKVDPATVPTGFLAAHNQVNGIPRESIAKAFRRGKTDVFIEHVRLTPNQAQGFHTHPGPVFVTVATGSLINEDAGARGCRRKTYGPDRGFLDPGVGHPHRVVAGPSGADFYAVYLLPRRTGPNLNEARAPRQCAS